MKWFGRKAGRVAARPSLTRGWGGPAIGETPRSYDAQVRASFLQNPVAQRAVRLVAEGVASATIYAEGQGSASNSARAESLLNSVLLETVAAQLVLHGNAFVQILCDAGDVPAELFALRPDRVTIEADANGWPTSYVYKAGEAKSRLPARDGLGRPSVVHLKGMHPLDDHYGLGYLGSAAGAVAIHNAATCWNKALLDNAARPSGALVYEAEDGTPLSTEQYERLMAELTGFMGSGHAGRPMLLEGVAVIGEPSNRRPDPRSCSVGRSCSGRPGWRHIALRSGPPLSLGRGPAVIPLSCRRVIEIQKRRRACWK